MHAAGANHMLSSLTGKTTIAAPRDYVERLFDKYASKFENSLVNKLEYRTPKLLADIIVANRTHRSLGSVLDIGCGTGLMGIELRELCQTLEGIDLSKFMLEKARFKKVYDKLGHTDITEYLSAADLDFDYYVSTDVFIYVGDLTEIFRLIKSRNKRSGKLVFSTEHIEGDGFILETSGRYSHSKKYIESLCQKFDYRISHFEKADLRKEKNEFLTGGLYLLDF